MKMKRMAESGFGFWKIVSLTITVVNKLVKPNSNKIYLYNFADNADDKVNSYNSTNIWNSSEEMTYTYNGNSYINYLGNYWSDYTGEDANNDGMGDTHYLIDSDRDSRPLMGTFENYFIGGEMKYDKN